MVRFLALLLAIALACALIPVSANADDYYPRCGRSCEVQHEHAQNKCERERSSCMKTCGFPWAEGCMEACGAYWCACKSHACNAYERCNNALTCKRKPAFSRSYCDLCSEN